MDADKEMDFADKVTEPILVDEEINPPRSQVLTEKQVQLNVSKDMVLGTVLEETAENLKTDFLEK